MVHWNSVLEHARAHAKKHAWRHFVLCDAHVPSGGLVKDCKLRYDFHSFPPRNEEVPERPQQGRHHPERLEVRAPAVSRGTR